MRPTEQQKQNFRDLAMVLRNFGNELPDKTFDMSEFSQILDTDEIPYGEFESYDRFDPRQAACGTHLCAIGCAASYGIGIDEYKKKSWSRYILDAFGINHHLTFQCDIFEYLFGKAWSRSAEKYDRTPEAAAERIEEYIENGFSVNITMMDSMARKTGMFLTG